MLSAPAGPPWGVRRINVKHSTRPSGLVKLYDQRGHQAYAPDDLAKASIVNIAPCDPMTSIVQQPMSLRSYAISPYKMTLCQVLLGGKPDIYRQQLCVGSNIVSRNKREKEAL